MVRPPVILTSGLFLDLRSVEQRGNDCSRADAYGDACLYQFLTALIARVVGVVFVGHSNSLRLQAPSMGGSLAWEAGRG